MVLIRYWASFYGLCGAADRNRITNYALNMLMIFYLQIHGILPSVKSLQENLKNEDSMLIGNLQCGYPKNVLDWPQLNENGKSTSWLIHNFFKFYSIFDYKNQKICPYSGEFTKKKFSTHEHHYGLHVDDPFDLDFNLTHGYKSLSEWKEYCTKTALITEKFIESDLQVKQNRSILDIFDIKPHREEREALWAFCGLKF